MIIERWNKDPEFQSLPDEKKSRILSNYFNDEMADDEFRALPGDRQNKIRTNFLTSEGFGPPTLGDEFLSVPKELGKGVVKGTLELGQSLGTGIEMVGQEMKKDRSSIIAHRPERWGLLTPTQMKEVVDLKQSYLKVFEDPEVAEQRAFEDVLKKESEAMAPSGDFLIKQGKAISGFWKGEAEEWQPSVTRAGKIEDVFPGFWQQNI